MGRGRADRGLQAWLLRGILAFSILGPSIQTWAGSEKSIRVFELGLVSGPPTLRFGLQVKSHIQSMPPFYSYGEQTVFAHQRGGSHFQEIDRGRILSISGPISHASVGDVDFDLTLRKLNIEFLPHPTLDADVMLIEIESSIRKKIWTLIFAPWRFADKLGDNGYALFFVPFARSEIHHLTKATMTRDYAGRWSAVVLSINTDAHDPTVGRTYFSGITNFVLDHRYHSNITLEHVRSNVVKVIDESVVTTVDQTQLLRLPAGEEVFDGVLREPRASEVLSEVPIVVADPDPVQLFMSAAAELDPTVKDRISRLRAEVLKSGALSARIQMETEFRALEDIHRNLIETVQAVTSATCAAPLEAVADEAKE
jgi:hypothetical protein